MLYEILHRPEYKNVTGLAEVLNVYLEEQYDILDEEDIKLKQEEDEVAYERKRYVYHSPLYSSAVFPRLKARKGKINKDL